MGLIYSREMTDKFLNKYKELESLQTNDYRKFTFLINKYRREYEMFRHMRNELSHSEVNNKYPFVVSEDVVELISNMLDEVKDQAYTFAKKAPNIIHVKEDDTIGDVINYMNKYNYSFLPVLDGKGWVKGIISSDSIMHIINHRKENNFNYDDQVTKYMDLFSVKQNGKNFYMFVPRNIFVYELNEMVDKYQHSKAKLGIILITQNGGMNEKLQGILTPWDLLKLNY